MQTLKAAVVPAIVLFIAAFAGSAVADNTVFLQSSTYTVSESAGTAAIVVLVTRAAGNQDTITVDYKTADGSAIQGSDYITTAGTLIFAPNETAKLIQIPIVDDLIQRIRKSLPSPSPIRPTQLSTPPASPQSRSMITTAAAR